MADNHEGESGAPAAPGPTPFVVPFVVGYRRSGLGLVRAMCDSHPSLAVAPESRFAGALVPEGNTDPRFEVKRFVDALYTDDDFSRWGPDLRQVERSFVNDPPADVADAVRRVFVLGARTRGTTGFGMLVPDLLTEIDSLARLLPEARIVHVVRDGRDVAASLVEQGRAESVERVAPDWRQQVRRARRLGLQLGPERYHELRYEDLVTEPVVTLSLLCRSLGVPFDPAMLDYRSSATAALRITGRPHENRYVTGPLRPGLRDWRRDMPFSAVDRFEALAGDLLGELGYSLHTPRRGLGRRLVARIRLAL